MHPHPTTTTHDDPPPAPPVDDGPEDNWGGWRAPAALLACINHPDRTTAGRFDDEPHGYCHECVGPELLRRRLWLVSFRLVRGGVEAFR